MLGGVCTNTGAIPSKTLREAALYLTGITQRELYGASYRVKDNITPLTCWPTRTGPQLRHITIDRTEGNACTERNSQGAQSTPTTGDRTLGEPM